MIHKQLISACALMLLVLAGCDSGVVNVRAVPTPEPEQPPANLPVQLHQRNWTGSLGQGSCVHASLVNHLRWLNRFELGERWRTTYADGEWDSRLRDRLDAAGIDYSYMLIPYPLSRLRQSTAASSIETIPAKAVQSQRWQFLSLVRMMNYAQPLQITSS